MADADEIRLTIPRDEAFHAVAELVLTGVASRRNATFEGLEDLRIALDTLFARRGPGDELTLALTVDERQLRTSVGPFQDDPADERCGEVPVRRILETVSDRFELRKQDGGHWVDLTKTLSGAEEAS
jgi:hypothetical protein